MPSVAVHLEPDEVEAVLAYLGPVLERARFAATEPLFRAHYKLDVALLAFEENRTGQERVAARLLDRLGIERPARP